MSSFILKIIAIITMTIDHIGFSIFNNNLILRIIGRIAMPIFAFQIAVGFKKTHSKPKYISRLLLTALISEIPYLLLLSSANYFNYNLNICFTFTFALLILSFIELSKKNKLFIIASLIPILISIILPMDYGIFAILLVLTFYFFGEQKIIYTISMIFITLIYYLLKNNSIQSFMLLSLPFLYLYNGKKGISLKYWFYAFYPMHMLIIAFIKFYLNTIKI